MLKVLIVQCKDSVQKIVIISSFYFIDDLCAGADDATPAALCCNEDQIVILMTNGRILYYRPTGKTYAKTESNLGMRVSSAAHCAALNSLLVAVKGLLLILPFDQQQKAKKVQTDFQDIQRMFVWKDVLFVVESLNMYRIAL